MRRVTLDGYGLSCAIDLCSFGRASVRRQKCRRFRLPAAIFFVGSC
jgi:hypothetical protein